MHDTGTIGGKFMVLFVEPDVGIDGLFLSRLFVATCLLAVEFLSRLFVTIR